MNDMNRIHHSKYSCFLEVIIADSIPTAADSACVSQRWAMEEQLPLTGADGGVVQPREALKGIRV